LSVIKKRGCSPPILPKTKLISNGLEDTVKYAVIFGGIVLAFGLLAALIGFIKDLL